MKIINLLLTILGISLNMCSTQPEEKVLCLQPCNSFTEQEAKVIKQKIESEFFSLTHDSIQIRILPNIKLGRELKNSRRYRGDRIIHYFNEQSTSNEIILGLMHEDISVSTPSCKDWGVLGYAYSKGGNAGVVSDHRLRNKHDLWKVAVHEFIHTYYNYGHCPEDNPNCFIQAGHGKANTKIKTGLCKTCLNNLRKK